MRRARRMGDWESGNARGQASLDGKRRGRERMGWTLGALGKGRRSERSGMGIRAYQSSEKRQSYSVASPKARLLVDTSGTITFPTSGGMRSYPHVASMSWAIQAA
jgi:hypothetical protein